MEMRVIESSYGWCGGNEGYGLLATREIPCARTLTEYLLSEPEEAVYRALADLFEVARRMHCGGLFHSALTPDSIIVGSTDRRAEELYIEMTPDSMLFPSDISRTKMAEWDLVTLTRILVNRLKFPSHRVPLEAYGLDSFECAELVSRIYLPRRSRVRDRLARAEFVVRWWLASHNTLLGIS